MSNEPRPKLLPDPKVAARYDVHTRTIKRWDKNPALNFPPAIKINDRSYRDVAQLDSWDLQNSREAAARTSAVRRDRSSETTTT
jgi:hypothetical protein